jgi:adenylate kinase
MATQYIVLMGVQGAGKGTQAAVISKGLALPHITTGGLFREMNSLDTPLAKQVKSLMEAGHLVPDDITVQVVRDRLKRPDAANGAIFDGFPRTVPQAEALDQLLQELGHQVTIVPFFELPREEAIARIADRWECTANPTHVYNLRSNPPKVAGICDIDGAPLRQRADDTPEAAAKRIDLFYEKTMPLLNFYERKGVLAKIDANQAIDKVTADLTKALAK